MYLFLKGHASAFCNIFLKVQGKIEQMSTCLLPFYFSVLSADAKCHKREILL